MKLTNENAFIRELGKKYNLNQTECENVIRSQFEFARICIREDIKTCYHFAPVFSIRGNKKAIKHILNKIEKNSEMVE